MSTPENVPPGTGATRPTQNNSRGAVHKVAPDAHVVCVDNDPVVAAHKPTVAALGIDVTAQEWQRSGDGDDALEIAFAGSAGSGTDTEWVLVRVAGDPQGLVLVYDRHEWECFVDGVRSGEFDDAAS
jgi:hypothetical protein